MGNGEWGMGNEEVGEEELFIDQCPILNSQFHIACAKIKPNLRAKAK
ncbi:hypothetical protein [Nostoc sp.]